MDTADACAWIPFEYRLDGFGQLGTALLVCTVGVDPRILSSIFLSLLTTPLNFLKSDSHTTSARFKIVVSKLLRDWTPRLQQNGICISRASLEEFQLEARDVDQPHVIPRSEEICSELTASRRVR